MMVFINNTIFIVSLSQALVNNTLLFHCNDSLSIRPYYLNYYFMSLSITQNKNQFRTKIFPHSVLQKICWYKLCIYPISNGSIHKINISLGKHYKYITILYWIEIGLNAKDLTLIHNPPYAKFLVFNGIQLRILTQACYYI